MSNRFCTRISIEVSSKIIFLFTVASVFINFQGMVYAQELTSPTVDPSPTVLPFSQESESIPTPTMEDEKESDTPTPPEEAALDTWIKKTPNLENYNEEDSFDEEKTVDDKAMLEEEKRVYQQLIGSYKGANILENSINRVFQKGVLSKQDQQRIEKIKTVQLQVRRELSKKYQNLYSQANNTLRINRLCTLTFDVMGLPKEVQKYKPAVFSFAQKIFKNSIKEISLKSCEVVLMSGLVSKTHTNAIEFLDNTKGLLEVLSNKSWSYKETSATGGGFFAVFFNTNVLKVQSSQYVDQVSLRRGVGFVEDKFSIFPIEILYSLNESENTKIRIIAYDFIYESNPFKPIPLAYKMQMAAALKEVVVNRSNLLPSIPTILLASLRFDNKSSAFHVMSNHLGLENFVSDGGCKIVIDESKKESYSCDSEKIEARRRVLFGAYLDMYHPSGKVKQSAFEEVAKNKRLAKQEIFVLQKDINLLLKKDFAPDSRAGFQTFTKDKIIWSLSWADFNFQPE